MLDLRVNPAFLDYLNNNWELLAASGYSGYKLKGRGVLWVDWLNQLPITTPLSQVSVLYLQTHSRLARSIWPEGMSTDLRRLIRQYDPEESIVVYWSEGDINRARTVALVGAASPAEAYGQMKARLPEFEVPLTLEE